MWFLVSLSVFGLGVGAVLVPLGKLRAETASALDGLALGMLPALILARLLPHAFESLGMTCLAFAAGGFLLASLPHSESHDELRLGSALVLPALWLHAVSDGAALAMSSSGRVGDSGVLLAAAAILHRVPEGLFVAGQRRRRDWSRALLAVSPLGLATVLGALLGQRIFDLLPDQTLDAVLALGAGAMLRLVGHSHGETHAESGSTRARVIAASCFVVGLAGVLAMPDPNDVLTRAQPRELAIAAFLLPLFIESAPALLLGLCGMSTLRALLRAWEPEMLRVQRGPLNAAWRGLTLGLAPPLGASARLAALDRLLEQGLPTAAVLAFTASIATLGGDAAAWSLQLLGLGVTLGRVVMSVVLVMFGAWCCARAGSLPASHAEPAVAAPAPRDFLGAWRAALRDQLEHHTAGLLFGLLAAAALEAALAPEWLTGGAPAWDVLLAAFLALPGYVSALGATPIAAVLLHKGASVGAVLAWLCASPVLNLALLGLLRRRLGLRAAATLAGATLLLTAALGALAKQLVPVHGVPDVHALLAHRHTEGELLCAVVLAGLLLATLLRLGPRGLAAGLAGRAQAHGHHHHGSAGGPGHEHERSKPVTIGPLPEHEAHFHGP